MSNNPELAKLIETTTSATRELVEGLDVLLGSKREIFPFNRETIETIKTLLVVSTNLNLRLEEERDALQEQSNLLMKRLL